MMWHDWRRCRIVSGRNWWSIKSSLHVVIVRRTVQRASGLTKRRRSADIMSVDLIFVDTRLRPETHHASDGGLNLVSPDTQFRNRTDGGLLLFADLFAASGHADWRGRAPRQSVEPSRCGRLVFDTDFTPRRKRGRRLRCRRNSVRGVDGLGRDTLMTGRRCTTMARQADRTTTAPRVYAGTRRAHLVAVRSWLAGDIGMAPHGCVSEDAAQHLRSPKRKWIGLMIVRMADSA